MDAVDGEARTRLSESAPDPYVGRTIDGYRVEEILGRGGMGVVYKATQISLGRPVAIKVLPDAVAGEPQFLDRFEREVDILSRLSHPNVVTVFERGEVDGHPYLVMEYVRGTSLRDVLRKGPLPASEAFVIVRSILSALEHAHDHGIVHRDIKPENVLLAPGGIVKVADFGLSRVLAGGDATRLTKTHLMLGTYEYMAPEQREKAKEADERSDLYATGVVLYEALAGELPIGHFEPLSSKRPKECDDRIDGIVRRSLDKEPARRYQRASEMGEAVSRLLSHAPEEPARCRRKPRRHEFRWQHHGLAAPLIAMAGVAYAALHEFQFTSGQWTIWACAVGAAILTLPWLFAALFALLGGAFWLLLLVAPAAAVYWAGSAGGDSALESPAAQPAWVYGVADVEGEVTRAELDGLLADRAVRDWVERVAGRPPDGAALTVVGGGLDVRVEGSQKRARDLAVALAAAAQRAFEPRVHRTIRGDEGLERILAANPPPVAGVER